jgi:hypothetical protein
MYGKRADHAAVLLLLPALTVSGAALLTSPAPVVLSLFAGPWSIFWSVSALSADARAGCLLSTGASVTSLTSWGGAGVGDSSTHKLRSEASQPASGLMRAGSNHNESMLINTGGTPAGV